jgi:hypothetical protein
VEAGVLGYDDMGFTAFGAEEEQGMNQMWGGSIQGYQQTPAGFDAEQDQGEDMDLHAWEWGGDPMGLEISQEAMHEIIGGTMGSAISSTSMISDLVASTDSSPAVQSIAKGPSRNDAPSSSASNNTTSAEEWHCNFTNCGKSFTHRHKLNRHRKYHSKPYACLDPSCSRRNKSFSLKKDLDRHQAKHNGQRFHCPHGSCNYSIGGAEGGFTRKDNLKRHIREQH